MDYQSIAVPGLTPNTRVTITGNNIIPRWMDGTITGIDHDSYYPLYQAT